jgi:exopolyphosphatase/guanosine-5'-triphosphate,3'-diphosphate pyrophosphatase
LVFCENAIERDIAVIDIGSNSVRMVHFRLEGRAIWPVFNEKVMAGLGLGVSTTGRLHPDGVSTALRALKRFARLLQAKNVSEIFVVATAAVRNADDGVAFAARVLDHCGLTIRVLTGEDEGALSALGLVSGIPDARGVVGDLGGSSLELARVADGQCGAAETFELGPQIAIPDGRFDEKQAVRMIDAALSKSAALRDASGRFYAIGGAWRALAQLAFARGEHPLRVVHQFELGRNEALQLAELATGQSPASLVGIRGISSRRAATLPWAALLMRQILRLRPFGGVVFSAFGLREGVLMDSVAASIRSADPLVAGAEALARPVAPSPGFGRALAEWISPAMSELETAFSDHRDRVLRETAARLIDMGARMHPDHRVELMRDTALYAPFAGITHAERVFLAAVLHHRYGGRRKALADWPACRLLDDHQHDSAQILGLILRLAAKLSGRSGDLLQRFKLSVTDETIRLDVEAAVRDLYVERSVSLMGKLADVMKRQPDIRYQ